MRFTGSRLQDESFFLIPVPDPYASGFLNKPGKLMH
jgi:hypothetical protein